MRKFLLLFAVCLAFVLLFLSCKEDYPNEEIEFKLSELGEAVVLSSDGIHTDFEWYKCDDATGENAVKISDSATIDTGVFTEPEIRYYICIADGVERQVFCVAYTGIPTVHIDTDDGRDVYTEAFYSNAEMVVTDSESPLSATVVQIKGRGSSSWFFSNKKGFNLKFNEKTKLLGMSKGKKWVFIANFKDDALIGNWLAFKLSSCMDKSHWVPDSKLVNVVMNGDFKGCYTVIQALKLDSKRIDIPDISELDRKTDSIEDGGFLLEIADTSTNCSFCTLHGVCINFKDPDLEEIEGSYSVSEIREYVRQKVNRLEAAIFGETDQPFSELIDVESLAKWYIVNEFMGNAEASFKTSCYIYYDPSIGKFIMGPVWDFDRNNIGGDPMNFRRVIDGKNSTWLSELIKDETFVAVLKKCWAEGRESFINLSEEAVNMSKKIDVSGTLNALKWNISFEDYQIVEGWFDARLKAFDNYIDSLI